jgi:hypothetical protein
VKRRESKINAALSSALNRATSELISAVRHCQPGHDFWNDSLVREAESIYRGIWEVSLHISPVWPTPQEWLEWALPVALEVVAAERRRNEARHAA